MSTDVILDDERVAIRGVTLFGRHGVRSEEREHGQLFTVDVELTLARPSDEDELASTVDYTDVIERVRSLNEETSYRLIESFAQAVARDILDRYEVVCRVRVHVGKQLKKLGLGLEGVSTEVCLRRGDAAMENYEPQ
ncbi:MAG: dihydroneopterin aldolase [Candidatus Bipolaricaulia bacterium]